MTNPKAMRIYDSSIWDENHLSSEIKLDIISPGFVYPSTHIVSRNFDRIFNSSNLGIYPTTEISELTALPDGIYIVRLTNINGEKEDWVEYNHLRQTLLLECWYKALCKINLDKGYVTKDKEKQRRDLYQIKMYIDAAKAKVEFCKSPDEGLELHNYAKKMLGKYNECNC